MSEILKTIKYELIIGGYFAASGASILVPVQEAQNKLPNSSEQVVIANSTRRRESDLFIPSHDHEVPEVMGLSSTVSATGITNIPS